MRKSGTETSFDINTESEQNNKRRKYFANSSKPPLLQPSDSFENKIPLTQHNKLYSEPKDNCQHSSSINLTPTGSSAHSSRSATSHEFYERSPYMNANEVYIFVTTINAAVSFKLATL